VRRIAAGLAIPAGAAVARWVHETDQTWALPPLLTFGGAGDFSRVTPDAADLADHERHTA
jgi:hypothetical protein